MAQVLKDDIKERIFAAALDEFFEKDFKTATMRDIAARAGIPTGLIYSYYKNKQALFDEIVRPVILNLPDTLREAEASPDSGLANYFNIERKLLLHFFERRREFILLIDKSAGTSYHDTKEKLIRITEGHIKTSLQKKSKKEYDDLFPHILACNCVESLLEILRHFKSREWAEEMLDLIIKHFFTGSDSL